MIQWLYDIPVINLSGEIGEWEGRALTATLRSVLDSENGAAVLDFSEVEHIDYRVLQRLAKRLRHSALRRVRVTGANAYHRDIIRYSGVESCMQSYDSIADAVLSLDRGGHSSFGSC